MLLSNTSPDARATAFGLNIASVGVSTGIAGLAFRTKLGAATCEVDPKAGTDGCLISPLETVGVIGSTFEDGPNAKPVVILGIV